MFHQGRGGNANKAGKSCGEMTMWKERATIHHPEAAATSAALEGRPPGGIPAVHPSRLAAQCICTAPLAP